MNLKQKVIATLVGGLAIAAIVAASALVSPQTSSAQAPAPPTAGLDQGRGPGRGDPAGDRDASLAKALGITSEALQTARSAAGKAAIEQAVKDGLITQAQADAGELSVQRQPLAPRALLDRLATAYAPQAAQRSIALAVDAPAGLPNIAADPERMAQVLPVLADRPGGNLITNALRHTPPGGRIDLSAQAGSGRSERGGRSEGSKSVVLSVQPVLDWSTRTRPGDNGEGMSAEVLPHVFDRFYRGDPARNDQAGESGLGLAIARSIVEAHGGQIGAASTPGQPVLADRPGGTTITITLPAA